MRLKDKVIVVTGSNSGIGLGIAEEVLRQGAKLVLHGNDEAKLKAAQEQLASDRVTAVAGDLTDPAVPQTLIDAALAAFGRLDGVVNNAGISPRHNIETATAEEFDFVFAVNLRAPMLVAKAAIAQFRKQKSAGAIVNIGSINAHCGQPDLLLYSMTKGGLQTMTRNLADAHGRELIRVNQLNVGWTYTENENQIQLNEGRPEDWMDHLHPLSAPSGTILRPEQIAHHAIFWLSDDSAPVSGSVYEVEQYPLIGRNRISDN